MSHLISHRTILLESLFLRRSKIYEVDYFYGSSLINFSLLRFWYSPDARPHPLQRLAFNTPSHSLDLYTPRYVKGSGSDKVGLCPICIEPISRGGQGTKLFLKTKVSAYSQYSMVAVMIILIELTYPTLSVSDYHMQYYHGMYSSSCDLRAATRGLHLVVIQLIRILSPTSWIIFRIRSGICARSNAPFSPPLQSRVTPRPRASIKERKEMKEGLCHVCHQWIPLQGTKDVDVMVKEIFWYVLFPFISGMSSCLPSPLSAENPDCVSYRSR